MDGWPRGVGPQTTLTLRVVSGDTRSQDCPNLPPPPWMVDGDAGPKETFFCDAPLAPMYFTADCLPLPGEPSSP